MSSHGLPSPAPRSASTGPNGPLPTPTSVPVVNGTSTNHVATGSSAPSAPAASSGNPTMSQQNLNQIVIDYLNKKGYHRTEAVLRAESSNQQVPPDVDIHPKENGPPKYYENFGRLEQWVHDALDIYKPEISRLLWPIFVYSYLGLVEKLYSRDATTFFKKYQEQFRKEHEYDLIRLERITLPEHAANENIAKIYRENKYRIMISHAAFQYFMAYLESLPGRGHTTILLLCQDHVDIRQVDRASDDRFSFAGIIERASRGADMPLEDEGIPGHRPGNAVSSTDPNIGNNLATLRLGKPTMEKELEEDLRGDLMDLDLEMPPLPGHPSLVDTHDKINIKQEDDEEGPSRTEIPQLPSTARDVAMEVQKIRENRDRLKLEGRTGGIGPGLSCVMYTFHNTHDQITCLDFSGDNNLVAAGTSMSYIRVWSLTGASIGPEVGGQPQNSQRLIGHSGPVYSVSFQPSTTQPPNQEAETCPEWLLSCSLDGSIRLWNLRLWRCVVAYKGHVGSVWDVKWGPFGTYFASAGADKTARVWMTKTVQPVRFMTGHDDDVDCIAWHPNAAYIFTASSDKTVRMWSVSTGNAVRMFTGHTGPITALSCSRDGKTLASADDTGNILLWDLAAGRLLKKMRGHGKGGIWSLSWSVESTVLVSGGADCTVRVWDVTGPAKESTTKPGTVGAVGGGATAAGGPGASGAGTNGSSDAASKPGEAAAQATVLPSTLNLTGAPKKKGKDAVVTADQISAFATKASPVYQVSMTGMNLIIAGGVFLPENQLK